MSRPAPTLDDLMRALAFGADDLQALLRSPTPIPWEDCHKAELNSRRVEIDALAAMDWGPGKGFIRLEVTVG